MTDTNTNRTWYMVVSDDVKIHMCSNKNLAQQVVENLKQRSLDKNLKIEEYPEGRYNKRTYFYCCNDFEDAEVFGLQDFRLAIHKEDLSFVKERLLSEDIEKYDNNFYKLHSKFEILCLTPEQRNEFINLAKDMDQAI